VEPNSELELAREKQSITATKKNDPAGGKLFIVMVKNFEGVYSWRERRGGSRGGSSLGQTRPENYRDGEPGIGRIIFNKRKSFADGSLLKGWQRVAAIQKGATAIGRSLQVAARPQSGKGLRLRNLTSSAQKSKHRSLGARGNGKLGSG